MSVISVCGLDCSACYCFEAKMCIGCSACEGKVFHCAEGEACAIYDCCVNKRGFADCSQCSDVPCDIWRSTRDPKLTDEEFEKGISDRLACLKNKNSR